MQIITYAAYGIAIIVFIVLAIFAIYHSLRFHYISARMKLLALIFIVLSSIGILVSLYFLLKIQFS